MNFEADGRMDCIENFHEWALGRAQWHPRPHIRSELSSEQPRRHYTELAEDDKCTAKCNAEARLRDEDRKSTDAVRKDGQTIAHGYADICGNLKRKCAKRCSLNMHASRQVQQNRLHIYIIHRSSSSTCCGLSTFSPISGFRRPPNSELSAMTLRASASDSFKSSCTSLVVSSGTNTACTKPETPPVIPEDATSLSLAARLRSLSARFWMMWSVLQHVSFTNLFVPESLV